jgi:2-keto-4-pentenoate hydratase
MCNTAGNPGGRLNIADSTAIADAFVTARLSAGTLAAYPGNIPPDMDSAYACQDVAISLWPDRVAGWKVGWINDADATRYGERRLVGPIFASAIFPFRPGAPAIVPVCAGGFCAVEAEYVFELVCDVPVSATAWNAQNVMPLIASLRLGIEVASSPLASINDLGPAVTASDFGNNAGLVVSEPHLSWERTLELAAQCECLLDGERVGTGGRASIAGGPLAGLAFALNRNARRQRTLRAGDLITTGAATGVHPALPGQLAVARFGPVGDVACRLVAAAARRR